MSLTRVLVLPVLGLAMTAATAAAQDRQESTTLGGYGEVHYANPTGVGTPAEVTVKRFVLYIAHVFNDHITLRSEMELEDAKVEGGSPGGEVALEQLYLDYRVSDRLTARTGLLLPPVGIVNQQHEPPTFNGVSRPAFDHDVIPTTWREIGAGVLGHVASVEGLSYQVFLLNGLRAEGFSAEEGIRGGRQEGREATFANPSLTGRLEWVRPGLRVGGSFWYGGSSGGDAALGDGTFSAPIAVLALDGRYDRGPLAVRAVLATVSVSDADTINALYGNDVGSRIAGAYVEAAYNLLRKLAPASAQQLNAFVRHERFDTHAAVPSGVTRDPALRRRITTIGLSYKPTWNTVFKADYQLLRNAAAAGEGEVLSLGVGFQF